MCAAAPNHGHTLTGPAPLVTAALSPVTSTVHSAAAAMFAHLSASGTAAQASTAPLQQAAPVTTSAGTSTMPQMQPDSVTVPAQIPPVPSSCTGTRNPHDTALSSAASALFAHLSAVASVLAPEETVLEDDPALRRQTELPVEEDMKLLDLHCLVSMSQVLLLCLI